MATKTRKRTKAQKANDKRMKLNPQAYEARAHAAKIQRWAKKLDATSQSLASALRTSLWQRKYGEASTIATTLANHVEDEQVKARALECAKVTASI